MINSILNFLIKDVPYDLYTGLKPIPILPYNNQQFKYANKSSSQVKFKFS